MGVITARDIAKEIEEFDIKIDEVIVKLIKPKFINDRKSYILLDFDIIKNAYGFGLLPLTFMSQMRMRGFKVNNISPNGKNLLEIIIPPQDE